MTTPPPSPERHLEPHDIAAYLGGRADASARSRIEAHLADCGACTEELVAVRRLHRPARPGRRWLATATAAAAAVAAILLIPRAGPREAQPSVRAGGARSAVETIAPPDGATLGVPATFAWHPVPGATAYRISLTRADGDSVWAASLRDTTVSVPDSAIRSSPGTYYWYVDALLADGRSIAGAAQQFRIGP